MASSTFGGDLFQPRQDSRLQRRYHQLDVHDSPGQLPHSCTIRTLRLRIASQPYKIDPEVVS